MTDGGLETTLIFLHDIDLPDFAAFPLVEQDGGREALTAYYQPYLDVAEARGFGIVLDTPTWRANPDWGRRLGYDEVALRSVNERAVGFVRELGASRPGVDVVLNGVVGPRGDGYAVGETMGAIEASSYHSSQIEALAAGGAHMVTGVTMTYVEEAIGIAGAAAALGIPAALGFTVETDGRLPSGMSLPDAIEAVDEATGRSPAWYMVNCAHPSHFDHVLDERVLDERVLDGGVLDGGVLDGGVLDGSAFDDGWRNRVRAIRANASRMSHAELDEAPDLDRGDPDELADDYRRLRQALPNLAVVGGCCGTDHEHLDRITAALA
jgi:S-methylmethionine-dependent homocysteine/selenocysteine methylase